MKFNYSAMLIASLLSLPLHAQTKTTIYTYDALGRLTFVEDSQNGNRDYDYDKAGNRLQVATGTANDAAVEPGGNSTLLPAPANPLRSHIANCAWKATWSPVTGASVYLVIDTTGGTQSVTGTVAYVNCPLNNPTGNQPKSVQACTSSTSCGPKSLFTN